MNTFESVDTIQFNELSIIIGSSDCVSEGHASELNTAD